MIDHGPAAEPAMVLNKDLWPDLLTSPSPMFTVEKLDAIRAAWLAGPWDETPEQLQERYLNLFRKVVPDYLGPEEFIRIFKSNPRTPLTEAGIRHINQALWRFSAWFLSRAGRSL